MSQITFPFLLNYQIKLTYVPLAMLSNHLFGNILINWRILNQPKKF